MRLPVVVKTNSGKKLQTDLMGILFTSAISMSDMWENLKKSKNGYCIATRQLLQNVVTGGGLRKYCQSHYRLPLKNDSI